VSKVFISADIEGVAGVVGPLQTVLGEPEFEMARRLMTLEVNAAIEGALEAGATEVVVCDSHAHMQNLIPEELHSEARLVRGAMRESLQMQGIDGSFDALFVTGAHAGAGTEAAVLDHTWVGKSVYNLRIDGETLNEACLNAITAGFYGVPLVLVTGDDKTLDQTRQVHPDVEGAVVKRSYSRYCAESLHPSKAREAIRGAARRALGRIGEFKPVEVPDELRMEIQFLRSDMAEAASLVPGVKRLDARTVGYTGDPETIFKLQELLLYRVRYEF
jgi:D-amino peptidase